MAMIEFRNVTKKYGATAALTDVTLQVPEGRTVGLLGRNGAGKTTALNLLTGYLPPTSGEIFIGGQSLLSAPRACKRLLGYLPEKPPLYDEMTVEEYLRFVCDLREVAPRARKTHVEEILTLCDLKEYRHRLLGHLSKGTRQRAGIAQALCGSPRLLVLDEPTVGLDPAQTVQMRELVRRLSRERTVLFSSHILSEVQQLCTDVVILHEGRLKRSLNLKTLEDNGFTDLSPDREGEPSPAAATAADSPTAGASRLRYWQLEAAGDPEVLRARLAELPCVRKAQVLPSGEPGTARLRLTCTDAPGQEAAPDQVFRLLARLDAPIRLLSPERDTLEEIFLRETGG